MADFDSCAGCSAASAFELDAIGGASLEGAIGRGFGCGGIAFGFDGFAIAVALALVVNDITGVASIAFGLDFAGGPDPGAAEDKTGLGDMMSVRAG